jgi:hypothetical protein
MYIAKWRKLPRFSTDLYFINVITILNNNNKTLTGTQRENAGFRVRQLVVTSKYVKIEALIYKGFRDHGNCRPI